MSFYAPLRGGPSLQQGDLLENVPFTYFSLTRADVLFNPERFPGRDSEVRDLTDDLNRNDIDALVAKVVFSWGIVVTQTCDLEPNYKELEDSVRSTWASKPVVVARVKPCTELFPQLAKAKPDKKASITRDLNNPGKTPNTFYLPKCDGDSLCILDAGADLLDVQRFARESKDALRRMLRLRLGPDGLPLFQERCRQCYGRVALPESVYAEPSAETPG